MKIEQMVGKDENSRFDTTLMPREEFKYTFKLNSDGYWSVYTNDDGHIYVGKLVEDLTGLYDFIAVSDVDDGGSVTADFECFTERRPEYAYELYREYTLAPVNGAAEYIVNALVKLSRAEIYDNLLAASILIMDGTKDEKAVAKKITKMLMWLHGSTDFYFAPGSTVYHDSYKGGLLDHHIRVARNIIQLQNSLPFKDVTNLSEAIFVALVHDWCKINRYEPYDKWVKDENNQWTTTPAFRYKDTDLPLGHGEGSMYVAQKFRSLKIEQALAIRWHMGAWRVTDSDMNDLQHSNEVYPLVHLLQFADQLSITDYAQ